MTSISVVIPTAARPEMLEVTLRSVARQTAVAEIIEVIVAENLGDTRSAAVCDRFPELPITYVLRDPQLSIMENARELLKAARAEFVAFVCDDDLWFPGHLENAVEALNGCPESVAHFSAFVGAQSELDGGGFFWGAPMIWLAAGRPDALSRYRLSRDQVLALSWLFTPFQWSTIVARAAAARAAAPSLTDSPHSFYADRMLCVALSRQGDILYDPAIDTLYRVYDGNWQQGKDPAQLESLLIECRKLVETEATALGIDIPALWRHYLSGIPDGFRPEAQRWFAGQFTTEYLKENGIAPLILDHSTPTPLVQRVAARMMRAIRVLAGR